MLEMMKNRMTMRTPNGNSIMIEKNEAKEEKKEE